MYVYIYAHIHGQLMFNKYVKNPMRKGTTGTGTTKLPCEEKVNLDPQITLYIKGLTQKLKQQSFGEK